MDSKKCGYPELLFCISTNNCQDLSPTWRQKKATPSFIRVNSNIQVPNLGALRELWAAAVENAKVSAFHHHLTHPTPLALLMGAEPMSQTADTSLKTYYPSMWMVIFLEREEGVFSISWIGFRWLKKPDGTVNTVFCKSFCPELYLFMPSLTV